jgi:hypothetical protein
MNPVPQGRRVFTRALVMVCLAACGHPGQDASSRAESRLRAESIAVAERFMRAVASGDSAGIAATTAASLARDLRPAGPDPASTFVQSALATFRPGDLIHGGGELLLEFMYRDAAGRRQKGYVRLDDTVDLKVTGILVI